MPQTVEAVVEKDGSLRFLEDVHLRVGERVLVTLHSGAAEVNETALLSEMSLSADWESDEEDAAWAHLQP